MNQAPCKECEQRHVGCHIECEEYKDFAECQKEKLKFCSATQTDVYIAQKRRRKNNG